MLSQQKHHPRSRSAAEVPRRHDDSPPPLRADDALLLDVDGTLIELAPSPTEVVVPPALPTLLRDLSTVLHGAIGVVSGRPLASVDELLSPWRPSGAGVHGAELRLPGSSEIRRRVDVSGALVPRLKLLLRRHAEVLIEDKGSAVAVHYARRPELQSDCEAALIEAMHGVPGLRVQRGRCVFEAVPADADKGRAVLDLMQREPFRGRRPVFVGDDHTDEMAFEAIRPLGGVAVKVGAGPSLAPYRLANPAAVWAWLRAGLTGARS